MIYYGKELEDDPKKDSYNPTSNKQVSKKPNRKYEFEVIEPFTQNGEQKDEPFQRSIKRRSKI